MDFSFTPEQEAVRQLARKIFADRISHERLRELEGGAWYDDEVWAELARSGIPGLALPGEFGGSDCSVIEICLVLEELGRHLAPVPLFPTLLLGGLPLAHFGSEELRRRWLPSVAAGESVLTAALEELGGSDPTRPRTTARREGSAWRLEGEKLGVPAAERASAVIVPARTDDGVGVFLLDPATSGVTILPQRGTNGEPLARLVLVGARVADDDVLAAPATGAAVTAWILDHALVGLCAIQLGVAEEALRRTARYAGERKQFGKPIGSFQGVALRAADAFIDLEAMRSTLYQAAWKLSEGLPASREVAVAKWWASRGGHRVVHTSQHIHGGIGADTDYPIHRYFLWARQIDATLGSASSQLARLGAMLAQGA